MHPLSTIAKPVGAASALAGQNFWEPASAAALNKLAFDEQAIAMGEVRARKSRQKHDLAPKPLRCATLSAVAALPKQNPLVISAILAYNDPSCMSPCFPPVLPPLNWMTLMELPSLPEAIATTLRTSDLTNIGADFGEFALDLLLQEGLLKDIPVIGTLRALWKTGISVRDELFLRKLIQFLDEFRDIPATERRAMVDRLELDEAYSQKVGTHIVTLLDRLDSMQKPRLIALAFKAYCRGTVDSLEMQRLLYIIDRVLTPDLRHLSSFLNGDGVPDAVTQSFVNCGLAWSPPNFSTTTIKPTKIATKFLECILLAKNAI